MPDYENDLAFKPAMTWEDLCVYAHERGFVLHGDWIYSNRLCFLKTGEIIMTGLDAYYVLAANRTYEQMKNIIDNLYGED